MKEAIIHSAEKVEIVDSPVPKPGPNQVVIKVAVSGSNPKDWKTPEWSDLKINGGDDIAGTVHSVGEGVYEFKPGDRVAAFHEMRTPGGSYAEYAVAWQHTTSHIPESLSFEEAATIPLAALTAVIGNYVRLGLPEPWRPVTEGQQLPFLVYGGASAVGAFAIKLARLSNIHPIIAVAGKGIPYVETLLDKSKGDAVVDYRAGDEAVVQGIKDALKASGTTEPLRHAFDAVSEKGSQVNLVAVLASDALVTNVLPTEKFGPPGFAYPSTYRATDWTMVGDVHGPQKEVGFLYFRWIFRQIAEKRFAPHPYEVVPGGLGGVGQGLRNLKEGRASATKYVFRIAETEGVGKSAP
ncbi:Alcohol dehydrogenase superfamily zinc-containing [Macrophomina phaseolina MS6]|uniref:Alcohol dehydrogenase superfamily zinc-containing n=1 Tax=Macrophomina phaseolina (strain MS6) TaxID=1126212 RepID=K2S0L9_MACPH|nr:Alcohol dehydrogenase superfamily zinc-containing [Macrophomina phaseolina MS6]